MLKYRIIAAILTLSLMINLLTGCSKATIEYKFEPDFDITSGNIYVANMSTDTVVFEKDSAAMVESSTLFQIVTAIIALERNEDLDERAIKITAETVEPFIGKTDIPLASLKVGETYTMRELLSLLMMTSAYDAATAIAIHLAATNEEFKKLMSEKIRAIGTINSAVYNVTGEPHEYQYTTAKDMYVLAKYAYSLPKYLDIVNQKSITIPSTEKQSERTIYNQNPLVWESSPYPIRVIKDGYSTISGDCTITTADKNGSKYMAIVLKTDISIDNTFHLTTDSDDQSVGDTDADTPEPPADDENPDVAVSDDPAEDPLNDPNAGPEIPISQRPALMLTQKLFDWAFATTVLVPSPKERTDTLATIPITGENFDLKEIDIVLESPLENAVSKDVKIQDLQLLLKMPRSIDSPLGKGTIVGSADVINGTEKIASVSIETKTALNKTSESTPAPSALENNTVDDTADDTSDGDSKQPVNGTVWLFLVIIGILIALFVVRRINGLLYKNKKRKRRRIPHSSRETRQIPRRTPQSSRKTSPDEHGNLRIPQAKQGQRTDISRQQEIEKRRQRSRRLNNRRRKNK